MINDYNFAVVVVVCKEKKMVAASQKDSLPVVSADSFISN